MILVFRYTGANIILQVFAKIKQKIAAKVETTQRRPDPFNTNFRLPVSQLIGMIICRPVTLEKIPEKPIHENRSAGRIRGQGVDVRMMWTGARKRRPVDGTGM